MKGLGSVGRVPVHQPDISAGKCLFFTPTLALPLRGRGFYGVASPFEGEGSRGMELVPDSRKVPVFFQPVSTLPNIERP